MCMALRIAAISPITLLRPSSIANRQTYGGVTGDWRTESKHSSEIMVTVSIFADVEAIDRCS
jgi:hypothetical protein